MLTWVVTHICPTTAGTGLGALFVAVRSTGVTGGGGSVLSRLILSSALKGTAVLNALAAACRPSSAATTACLGGSQPGFGPRGATRGTPSLAAPRPAGGGRGGRGGKRGGAGAPA